MEEENVLTEFENEKEDKKPIAWVSILWDFGVSIFMFYFGFLYYQMWKDYHNPQRVIDFCIFFSSASFMLSTALNQLIIRYKYIRKPTLKK